MRIKSKVITFLLAMMLICSTMSISTAAVNVLDNRVSITDTGETGKAITDGVEITVSATTGKYAWSESKATNTITIRNKSGSSAEISFNFSVENQESYNFTSGGTTVGSKHTVVLENDGSITITLTVKAPRGTTKTASLQLTDFEIKQFSNENVTVSVSSNDATLGTATVNNGSEATVKSGETVMLNVSTNNSKFLGWVDTVDNSVITTSTSYTYTAAESSVLKAVFINSNSPVWFAVGNTVATTTQDAYESLDKDGTLTGGEYDMAYTYYTIVPMYLYNNLADALSKANSSSYKGVVPMNSGTISGDYTIPAGVTLLIPFDSANTMYTTVPGFIYTDNKGVETLYRSLTLAPNTNITVNGAISVSTPAHSADGTETGGYPCGDYSKIVMQQGSTITLNSGAALYAWGFITGDSTGAGTITVKNGATVYEDFQMAGHRGGNQSTKMKNKVFPISQYYVQNVEVPMTLEYGAVGKCVTWINVSSLLYKDTQVPLTFFGSSGGLFNVTRGSVTKSYDGKTDRWTLDINGDVTVSPIDLSFGDDGSINSKSYVLGINNNLTLNIKGGTVSVGQDIAFQPGSELNIDAGAKCILNDGISVYVYDGDSWGNFCFDGSDVPIIPIKFSPTKTYSRSVKDLVDVSIKVNGELDTSKGYFYTTAGGAHVFSTENGVVKMNACADTTTYQYSQAADAYTEIAATSALLTNANGSYVQTVAEAYTYFEGFWHTIACKNAGYWTKDECTCKHKAVAAVITENISDGTTTINYDYHGTLAATVDAYTSNTGYIQMLTETTEVTVGDEKNKKTIYLDLNGQTVTVTTFNVGTLYGMDSTGNSYGTPKGAIKCTVTAAPVATHYLGGTTPKHYIPVSSNGETSFHRAGVSVTGMQYTTGTNYIVLEGTFRGNNDVVTALQDVGFRFNQNSDTDTWYDWKDGDVKSDGMTFYYARPIEGTNSVQALLNFGTKTNVSDVAVSLLRNNLSDLLAQVKQS